MNGVVVERQKCLEDCTRAFSQCDDMYSESAVEACIDNINSRVEKEQNP
jgi:hypothetical protein